MARNVIAFYIRKGYSWRFEDIESLHSIRLGVIKGYDYRQWLDDYIKNNEERDAVQVMTGNAPLQRNLKKLIDSRLDVVVDNEAAIRWVAKSMGILPEIEAAGYGKVVSYCYIAFSPNSPNSEKYAAILSRGIASLRASGRLQEILDKYGLRDWRSLP